MPEVQKLHWLYELDVLPREASEYCKRHNYWYWPSQGCPMCQEEKGARAR